MRSRKGEFQVLMHSYTLKVYILPHDCSVQRQSSAASKPQTTSTTKGNNCKSRYRSKRGHPVRNHLD